ncbi:hypothetical protein OROMI_023838 [Orobanche minor]
MVTGHNVCARLGGIARPRSVAAIAPQGARSFFSMSYLASEEFKEKYINGSMWVLAFLFGITVLKVKKGEELHNVCARLGGIARPRPVAAIAPQGARSFFSRSYLASEEFKEKYINGSMWVLAFLFGITVLKVKKGEELHNVCARLGGIARPRPVAAIAPQGARSFFSRSYLASEEFKEKYINGSMWVLAFLFGITVLKVKKG